LLAFIDFHLGLGADADKEALACWILLSGEALRDEQVRTALERALAATAGELTTVIAQGVRQGGFSCEEPAAAAGALLATIQGYFVLAATARSLIPKGSAAAATRRMAAGLLQTAAPPLHAGDTRPRPAAKPAAEPRPTKKHAPKPRAKAAAPGRRESRR
jgi:TetR/AcrR family transcriptional repressor of bet genes